MNELKTCEEIALPAIDLSELSTQEAIDALEEKLLRLPQVDMPLTHSFAPGVYMREIVMPAASFVIGHRHKTEHFNIVLTGRAKVLVGDGEVMTIQAPCTMKSHAGIRKVLLIEEEMRWITVHVTDETDIAKLEEALVSKTPAFLAREKELKLEREQQALVNQPGEDS